MTTEFNNYFQKLLEDMTANDVANVGTGWNDSAGSVPKVLGKMQRRGGLSSRRRKKRKK